jgi:hypothetical protein
MGASDYGLTVATFSKREQKMIDRLRASGYELSDNQLDARFTFLVRPFTTVGVEKGSLASSFEQEIFAAIRNFEFESPITGIVIFPTIFDGAIAPVPPDYVKYKKGEKSVFVGMHIDFSSWASASTQVRLGLLADNIKNSIERIPDKYLSAGDRKRLLDITSQVHKRLIDRLVH